MCRCMPQPWDVFDSGLLCGRDQWGNDVYVLEDRFFTVEEVYAPEYGCKAIVRELERYEVKLSLQVV